MILGQILPVQSLTTSLRQGVETLARELELPERLKPLAYCDQELVIWEKRFILAPPAFFKLVSAANITQKETVLDIGCTTGYTTGILSYCSKKVIGIEASETLVNQARIFLAKNSLTNAEVFKADPLSGYPEKAPYNVIIVEGALKSIPACLSGQLLEGGRLLFFKKRSPDEIATAICAYKKNGHLFEEELFEWQASYFEPSLESPESCDFD
tara:strand:+ start:666 stop:1301 length:636 start_codon:yes stop_codon:yes gene_type:complete